MSYWKHCDSCDHAMGHPDLEDALLGEHECEKCMHPHPLDKWDRKHRVEEMLDRLAALEAMVVP